MGKKSTAKANGLKSTFKLGDNRYVMTSFGKGNSAVEEKYIEGRSVQSLHQTYTAEVLEDDYASVTGAAGSTGVMLPQRDNNMLGAKAAIEQMFFGKAFDDNIHIQIAYKVMDIKRLFCVYANNIIHTVNNLLPMDFDKDFIGKFSTVNDLKRAQIAHAIIKTRLISLDKGDNEHYFVNKNVWIRERRRSLSLLNSIVYNHSDFELPLHQNISKCVIEQLGFDSFGKIKSTAKHFSKIKKLGMEKCACRFSDIFCDADGVNLNYVYESLRLLADMRQSALYGGGMQEESGNIYSLFDIESKATEETKAALDAIVENKLNALNDNFINVSAVNLNILFTAFPNVEKSELVKTYYDFSVRKAHKNIGVSVRKLREAFLAEEPAFQELNDREYDLVRSKLYSLIDFAVYYHYICNDDRAEVFVEQLRQISLTDGDAENGVTLDDKKLEAYKAEAVSLWGDISEAVLGKIIPGMGKCSSDEEIAELRNIDNSFDGELKAAVVNADELSCFAKAMYCVCAFLDAKEINMFLDSMISSFDNIASLINIAAHIDCGVEFAEGYSFFGNCGKTAEELRFIKSIARMNKGKKATRESAATIRMFQYYDAAAMFGEYDEARVTELFRIKEKSTKKYTVDHTLRNFFINNVINSNKYSYIVRFVDPACAGKIMENKALVAYAIGDMDDRQIIGFCESAGISFDKNAPELAKMRNEIVETIMQISFETFVQVSNSPEEANEKERLKAIAGLYLTVIYLIIKSLVRINTSYSIAFSAFERDCAIMNKKAQTEANAKLRALLENVSVKKNPMGITDYFDIKHGLNGLELNETEIYKGRIRAKNLVSRNERHYDDYTFEQFGNNVRHLAVLSRLPDYLYSINKVHSYFDLYHYLMLKILADGQNGRSAIYSAATEAGLACAFKAQSAYKDFLYGILAPFAYNPARYINLTGKAAFIKSYGK